MPITIGRRYDSLEKDKVGDFGYGWSLMIGHPRLEVEPELGVTMTLPNGRRATFDLALAALAGRVRPAIVRRLPLSPPTRASRACSAR